ncbi:MAG: DUF7343 domain-containing protein [Nanobdellota archaeon]
MDNRKLGIVLFIIALLTGITVTVLQNTIEEQREESCTCQDDFCPHKERNNWPAYIGFTITSIIAALGLYLLFFEKSQKEIISSLKKRESRLKEDERFRILMKGLSEDEKGIMKAVKEQDGITQHTLSLRTDIHKSKLSLILKEMEEKELLKRVNEGRAKKVYLKIAP